nr:MAG TPA: hypothetical protein [Bacteriophage sp.]
MVWRPAKICSKIVILYELKFEIQFAEVKIPPIQLISKYLSFLFTTIEPLS